MVCKAKRLFNPNGKDDNKLFCGDTTNILNLANVKYPEFIEWVDDIMYANNWLPKEVDMSKDKYQYEHDLTEAEKEAYENILSFLTFLDSVQTNNLPNIAEMITLPEIVYFLARQTWEEALHSRSYGHILSTAMSKEAMNRIIYKFRDTRVLLERNKVIAEWYEECKDQHDFKHLIKVIIANYLLEGLYFYNGFQFFHTLASRGLMIGTDQQIKFIQRDEAVHCLGFKQIFHIAKNENADKWNDSIEDMIYGMFKEAVAMEIKFSQEIIGDNILGISKQSIEDYAYHLGNKRLKDIELEEIFPKRKNPYKHLERMAGETAEEEHRANNFEVKSTTYKTYTVLDGWDEI